MFELIPKIIELSQSKEWRIAKTEWELQEVYFVDEDDLQTCLCGHHPIKEICIIRNFVNRNVTEVGNCCVKQFLGLPSDLIFQGMKRIRLDQGKAANRELVEWAFDRGYINQWEHMFCLDTIRKRKLTSKQADMRRKINAQILARAKKPRTA